MLPLFKIPCLPLFPSSSNFPFAISILLMLLFLAHICGIKCLHSLKLLVSYTWHIFNPLISSSPPPYPLPLGSWTPFHLQEIHSLVSSHPSSLEFFIISKNFIILCALPYSKERYNMVLKPVWVAYFTQHYIFQVHQFCLYASNLSFFIA